MYFPSENWCWNSWKMLLRILSSLQGHVEKPTLIYQNQSSQ